MQDKIFLSLLYRMNDPYHVYVDLDVINNDYNATSKSYLRFEETRNTPILPGDSADYFCSVVRFNVQTGNTLPVLIPKIETGQSNANKTIYQVVICFDANLGSETSTSDSNDFWGSANVIYEPEDLTAPIPAAPTTSQDLSSSYYYVYNYQHWIYLVNKAIESAWADLRSKFLPIAGGPFFAGTTSVPPWIDFDADSLRLIVNAPYNLFNSELWTGTQTPGVNRMKLVLNDRLYELFASLPYRLVDRQFHLSQLQTYSGRRNPWYEIRFVDRRNNKYNKKVPNPAFADFLAANPIHAAPPLYDANGLFVPPPPLPPGAPPKELTIEMIHTNQEMTSVALWNPVASIVFASSLLPIVATQTSLPKDVGKQHHMLSGGNNSNLLPILSDFSIAVDATNQYRPCVEYAPSAEYRLLDM
ncbi:MAG: hypothetical protein FJ211_11140, partial [Ignavibacteria bacterium]|nr:hypothetical protein [Ignavibacteria bacterium]